MKKVKMLVMDLKRVNARYLYSFFDDLFHFSIRLPYGLIIIERVLVYVSLTNNPIIISKPRVKVTIRKATLADIYRFAESMPWKVPSEIQKYSNKLKNGRICFIALDKDKIVSYTWLTFDFDRSLDGSKMGPPIRLRPGDIYSYDSYTLPEYRARGIGSALWAKKLEYSRQKGYERIISLVNERNKASRRMNEKAGRRAYEKIKFIKIFGFQRWRYENIK